MGVYGSASQTSEPAQVEFKAVEKHYIKADGSELSVLEGVDLSIREQEFVTIVGPSGSGKSTLLFIVAGLEPVTGGEVWVAGSPVTGPSRHRGVVFQEDAIFPWRTVRRNVEYGLEIQGLSKKERRDVTDHYLRIVGLEDFADLYPRELSGGMKKRVAIAAVLANGPDILLLDEPFGPLDYVTKLHLQEELARVWEAERKTALGVTHDIEEAVFLSDRVLVLKDKSITYEVRIDFPRPREHELRSSPSFIEVKERLWKEIE